MKNMLQRQLNAADANPVDIEVARKNEANKIAHHRILSNPHYRPASSLVPEDLAAEMESWLEPYGKMHTKTRVAMYRLIKFNLDEANWTKSRRQAGIELSISVADMSYWEQRWPHMWLFINTLARWHSLNAMGRVLGAMTDAAIHGDNRDRRLYLEFHGQIKREIGEGGKNQTIVFVNDNLNRPDPRPLPPPIDVEAESEE